MEVEVSGKSLDCPSYWPFALVADNSHVVHLDGKVAHQIGRLSISVITSYATTRPARRNAKMRNNPNETHGRQLHANKLRSQNQSE
jgi:hypothetical protein